MQQHNQTLVELYCPDDVTRYSLLTTESIAKMFCLGYPEFGYKPLKDTRKRESTQAEKK